MIDREMIERIVGEVVARLSKEDTHLLAVEKPNLLVVGDISFAEPEQLSKLQAKWSISHYVGEEKVRLDHISHVLFMHATQDLLVKGALGIFDTPESKLLSRCFMESTPVTIVPTIYLEDHLYSKSPRNKAYVAQLKGYIETLLLFGARVDMFERFVDTINGTTDLRQEDRRESKKKKILTRRDIQDCDGNIIEVDSHTIITPLARDTAREMEIDIRILDPKGAKR
ncbi:hypothetical protein V7138_02585 [Bacillus sp. JJ1533]|uniref:hypothetical protein n=1 Tax=Bacillus sp. JJ1533 TaxID=3122959 RepID=UPI002FFDE3EF